jgi:hypothetical protein
MWIFEWVFGWFGSGVSATEGPFIKTRLRRPYSSTNLKYSSTYTKTALSRPYSRTTQKTRM